MSATTTAYRARPSTVVPPGGARVRRRTAILAAGLLALVTLAVGLLGGMVLSRDGYADDSPEAGFARDMSTHHAQAVEMAMLAHARATDPDIAQLGTDIALIQQSQIGTMQAWLRDWDLLPTGEQPKMAWMGGHYHDHEGMSQGLMPGMATPEEMARLRAARGRDFDVLFCQLMLRHHEGGIAMADAALSLGDDPEVERLAGAMKRGQQSEIHALAALLARDGAAPA